MLALVPEERLPADTWFRVTATGLADVSGGAIVVPATTFVTTADVAPVYDVEQLVVSFPDADGLVTLRGPAGTLPPGSQVLIINYGSGEVSTFPVFNDGSTDGKFYAALTDRLQITDPLGRVMTFARDDLRTQHLPGGRPARRSACRKARSIRREERSGALGSPRATSLAGCRGPRHPGDAVALMKLSAIPQLIISEAQRAGCRGW